VTADTVQWKLKAVCGSGEYDPDLWFPLQYDAHGAAEAKRICNEECPVRAECAEYAINFPLVLTGVWGGLSRREIRAERVKRGLKVESEATFSNLPNYAKNGTPETAAC
jgi:hypothetical protein